MINARLETVETRPAYRAALASRRCLLPADGYYEWSAGPDGGKTPYFLAPRNGGVLAMAGLYELWRDPGWHRDDPAAWLWSAVIITTRAIDELGHPARPDAGAGRAGALHRLVGPAPHRPGRRPCAAGPATTPPVGIPPRLPCAGQRRH
jgi:hypothetical protein